MATLLRLLWSIAVTALVLYFVPSPWGWIWVGVIWAAWTAMAIRAAIIGVCNYAIENGWPLRRP
jgi:hypothetical protein